jgi:hypothetical protein
MKPAILFCILFFACSRIIAQVVVDGKNINEDKEIEYIQFSFFYESKKFNPVYTIDYGLLFNDNKELKPQKISIDKEEINSKMTPVYVMNRLYKSGWEYTSDGVFMPAPMMENNQMFTFRRKKTK